jgi:hypothetical protein
VIRDLIRPLKKQLSLREILETAQGEIVHAGAGDSVEAVVASSLMSDVLTVDERNVLLISNLTTVQVVRTADVIDASVILLTTQDSLIQDTAQLARELNITLCRTPLSLFETCYRIGTLIYGDKKP